MAMTQEQIDDAARELGRELFSNSTANLNLDDLRAIIQSIDNKFNANGVPGQTVASSIKTFVGPFDTHSDAEKNTALAVWARNV